jgi:class 3 adenylate cyclase
MTETRKIAAILAADGIGFSRMAGADEDRTLAQLRAMRSELVDPTAASQNRREPAVRGIGQPLIKGMPIAVWSFSPGRVVVRGLSAPNDTADHGPGRKTPLR